MTIDEHCQKINLTASLKRIGRDQIMEKMLKIKKAFSLVEVLIVMAALGIIVALTIPIFQNHFTAAKESAAKDNLRILRSAIQFYAVQHNGVPPGHPGGVLLSDPELSNFIDQLFKTTYSDGTIADANSVDELTFGPYLTSMPENPFNHATRVEMLRLGQKFPEEYIGPLSGVNSIGWIYGSERKEIKINHYGVDSEGIPFSSY
ncbi:type II secretion system protein [Planctomycetota bacterium]